jgi:DNA-binding NarL/FixJ family response regulator
LIRVRVDSTSTATRAGIEALLRDEPGIEIVDSTPDADVVIREGLPLGDDPLPRQGELRREDFPGMDQASPPSDWAGDPPVVLLTDDVSPQEALRSGARAALARSASPSQIVAAIYAVAAGLVAVPAESHATLSGAPAELLIDHLTPREMDVLEMLAEGLSNKLIADRLGISEHTAKFHVNSILAKLSAGTRTEAVMRGLRLGLIKI